MFSCIVERLITSYSDLGYQFGVCLMTRAATFFRQLDSSRAQRLHVCEAWSYGVLGLSALSESNGRGVGQPRRGVVVTGGIVPNRMARTLLQNLM